MKLNFFSSSQKKVKKFTADLSESIDSVDKTYLEGLEAGIVSGGIPKDGIPSIDDPKYISMEEADSWLLSNDIIFGVVYDDFIAAFPQRIMVLHEIVNENRNGEKISITYCPLSGSAIGYKGDLGKDLQSDLGVSGELVHSNLVMYDRITDSYWPQVLGKAINGSSIGKVLDEFPIVWTTWDRWKKNYPNTLVLSKDTGFERNYGVNGDPYGSYLNDDKGYYSSEYVMFPPKSIDNRLPSKTVVVGIRDNKGNAGAVVKSFVRKNGKVMVPLGRKTVQVKYYQPLDSYSAKIKETGEEINSFDVMWFVWSAYFPDTVLVK